MPSAVAFVVAAAVEPPPEEELVKAIEGLTAADWITAAAILFAAIALSGVVRSLAVRLVGRGDDSRPAARLVGRVGGAVVVVGGFVYALQVLGVSLGPLLGALGLGGLALAFAAQTILENVFASVLLQTRRPFRRGDQIETNDIEGTVEEVNLRTVQLRTYDGELVLVPCDQALGAPITNFTAKGSRRTTLAVGVAYESDLETVQRVLLAVATVDGVRPEPAPPGLGRAVRRVERRLRPALVARPRHRHHVAGALRGRHGGQACPRRGRHRHPLPAPPGGLPARRRARRAHGGLRGARRRRARRRRALRRARW